MALEQKARRLRENLERIAENGTEMVLYNATCLEMLLVGQRALGMRGDGPIPLLVIQWVGNREELLRSGVEGLVEVVGKNT